jgi:hypothetical protein
VDGGRYGVPRVGLDRFQTEFPYGFSDNPYDALEITHLRGSYLLINAQKLSVHSELFRQVQQYLFQFLPEMYGSFTGERLIDPVAMASINNSSKLFLPHLQLLLSFDWKGEIKGGMGFVISRNQFETLPLQMELSQLMKKGFITGLTLPQIQNFFDPNRQRIEGVRTYAHSVSTLKEMVILSGKILKNENRSQARPSQLVTLISERTYHFYTHGLGLRFKQTLPFQGFSAENKIDLLGEIDIEALPEASPATKCRTCGVPHRQRWK